MILYLFEYLQDMINNFQLLSPSDFRLSTSLGPNPFCCIFVA